MNKVAIFARSDNDVTHSVQVMIENDTCQIPSAFMEDVGTIEVSVYAGDRRTVNSETINVIQSGYKESVPSEPSEPSALYVQSPDSSIPYIGYDESFWFMADGEKKRIEGEQFDPSIEDRISSLESDSTAIWVKVNNAENQIRNLADRIAALEARA